MDRVLSGADHLRRLFAAVTEQTFEVEMGVADPRLVDYLSDLLVRFVRFDTLFRFRDVMGRRLEEVADMMLEAEHREAKPKREIHRHIGDFTLFWAGVYPEALGRLQAVDRKDHLIDYCEQGKRSYFIASTFDDEPYQEEAPVLRRLSVDFELCSAGLKRARQEWEKMAKQSHDGE
jgi:hypothetical protein